MASTLSLVSRNALEHVCERCKVKIAGDLASESINGGEYRGQKTREVALEREQLTYCWVMARKCVHGVRTQISPHTRHTTPFFVFLAGLEPRTRNFVFFLNRFSNLVPS